MINGSAIANGRLHKSLKSFCQNLRQVTFRLKIHKHYFFASIKFVCCCLESNVNNFHFELILKFMSEFPESDGCHRHSCYLSAYRSATNSITSINYLCLAVFVYSRITRMFRCNSATIFGYYR